MWRNRQWHFVGISGFWMVNFRLKSYLKLVTPSHTPNDILGQWDLPKETEMAVALRNHTYIRQLVQELMKWYLQASIRVAVYYSWTWARQIVCAVFCKYVNLYLCTSNISKAYTFIIAFFPILYRSLSTESPWFPLFF